MPGSLSNVTAIAAGLDFSLALKSDGTVVGWGSISVPSGLSNIIAIAAGGGPTTGGGHSLSFATMVPFWHLETIPTAKPMFPPD